MSCLAALVARLRRITPENPGKYIVLVAMASPNGSEQGQADF
jgi:hypothetical protein